MFTITHWNRAERPSKAAPPYQAEENLFARNPIILPHVSDERAVTPLTTRERTKLFASAQEAFPGRQFIILPDSVATVVVTDQSGREWRYRIEELTGREILLEGRHADPDYEGQAWRAILIPSNPWTPWKLVRLMEGMPWQAPEYREIARCFITRMVRAADDPLCMEEYRFAGLDLRFARAVPVSFPPRPVRHRRQMAGRRA